MDAYIQDIAIFEILVHKISSDSEANVKLLSNLIAQLQRVKNLENKKLHANHNQRWLKADNEKLLSLFKNNAPIEKRVADLKRTERSVDYQLSKLLIKEIAKNSLQHVAKKYNKDEVVVQAVIDTLHK